ncbi:MAG TPA: O-methyltransferase [Candidatus Acidoferrales bacterium]|nr:O-methyltransferase [Candidatus Acidoferrales bacterium]
MAGLILNTQVEAYMNGILPKRDPVLTEMESLAKRRDIPIIGPACARVLYLLAKLTQAKRVFEMGSAIGYSTIWLARAVGPQGRVYYTDGDASNARSAREFLTRAGVDRRVHILVGDALKLLQETPGKFDIIFIDVDKHQYPAALRLAVPRVRSGGLIITDNVLWSGKVTRRAKDENTRGVQEFNRAVYNSKQLFPIIVPLRDGVAVCQKI